MTRRSSIHLLQAAASIISILLLHSCSAFHGSHYLPNRSSFITPISRTTIGSPPISKLCVYTPEQAEDDKNEADQVLESLIEKLDKSSSASSEKKEDNKAMAFLRKRGKVGGSKDFANAVGSDEGSGMAEPISFTKKSSSAYKESTVSGVIDDLSEPFPLTSSGTEWRGVADSVRGGTSEGSIRRESVDEKVANLLEGRVSGENGFIQMVTELSNDPSKDSVDASDYDGIEIDVLSKETLDFNVHLRTRGSLQQNSFRHTVNLECLFAWQTVRIPFSSFLDNGSPVNYSILKRIGIVALDKETDVYLAVSGVRFYNVI